MSAAQELPPQERELPPLSGVERWVYAVLEALAKLPLPSWRGLGWLIGQLLYLVLGSRRKVAMVNLRLCFPEWTEEQRKQVVRKNFVVFVQTALDRIWLWHGTPELLRKRLRMVGDVEVLRGEEPIVLFAPHFVGLDAGGMASSGQVLERDFISIYTPQRNAASDTWARRGRTRRTSPTTSRTSPACSTTTR